MFQFYLSSIKSIIGVCLKRGIFKFQFYLSSIKRSAEELRFIIVAMFQFYLSSIKSRIMHKPITIHNSFNSTLVQLKGCFDQVLKMCQ